MKKFDSINVVPFIDVLLVLLVIVLTTTTFISQGIIPVDLPQASSQEKHHDKSVVITIQKDGKLFFDKEMVSLEELKERLPKLPIETQLTINCDKEAKFDHFVRVLDEIKQHPFANLSILTQQ